MSDPEALEADPQWDDVVDVICVGSGAGALAYGLCCAAAGLDVLLVHPPTRPDSDLAGLIAAMTDDLGDPPVHAELAVGTLSPAPQVLAERRVKLGPVTLEPFVGQKLRDWSADCLGSPYGVMFTQIPDVLTPMMDASGGTVTAAVLGPYRAPLGRWLAEQAHEHELAAEHRLADLVIADGRVAGAVLDTSSGPWRVGATAGLAVAVGPAAPVLHEPTDEDLEVAVIGRRFGRFARVELVRR